MEEEKKLRIEVYWFAQQMERKLQEHDDRPGWIGEREGYLLDRLHQEVCELAETSKPLDIINEAADVANMAMMIADTARCTAGISFPTIEKLEKQGLNDEDWKELKRIERKAIKAVMCGSWQSLNADAAWLVSMVEEQSRRVHVWYQRFLIAHEDRNKQKARAEKIEGIAQGFVNTWNEFEQPMPLEWDMPDPMRTIHEWASDWKHQAEKAKTEIEQLRKLLTRSGLIKTLDRVEKVEAELKKSRDEIVRLGNMIASKNPKKWEIKSWIDKCAKAEANAILWHKTAEEQLGGIARLGNLTKEAEARIQELEELVEEIRSIVSGENEVGEGEGADEALVVIDQMIQRLWKRKK